MLDLSPETEALAHRLAKARHLTVDKAVRDALEADERSAPRVATKDMSPEAIAARIARMDEIVAEIAAMPILDSRPVQEIIDEINTV